MPTKKKATAAGATSVPEKKKSAVASAKKKSPAAKTVKAAKPAKAPAENAAKSKSATPKKPVAKKKSVAETIKPGHGLDLVRRCVNALDDKKASSIEVIYVGENSSITDYFVIATGTSDPHLRALRIALEKAIDAVVPEGAVRVQNEPGSGWCVVDAFDVVVHVLSAEQRENYDLEELYSSGEKINIKKLL